MLTLSILCFSSCEKNNPTGYIPTTDNATSSVTSSSQPEPAGNTPSAMRPAVAEKSDPSAIKAIDNNTVPQTVSSTSTATSTSQATNNLNCDNLARGTWVNVPGDTIYGTSDFCVQKYIPSDVNSVPTSQPGTTPWVTINFSDSKSACSSLGQGYHLITNPEWMTIAANIANTNSNWSGGVVGSGELTRGHSDNSPAQACQADADDANAWVDGAGDCTGKVQGSLQFRERRTRKLSNDSVLWDIGGNVWQWVDAFNPNNKPVSLTTWVQFSALGSGTADWPRSAFVPLNQAQSWWDDSWSSTQSIGQIYTGLNGVGGALRRGARWSDTTRAGLFSAYMELGATGSFIDAAPRCAYTEATYSVTYDGNGATSGTVPTDSAKYSATQPVSVLANSGSLAKSGYSFAGWSTAADGTGTTLLPGAKTFPIGTSDVILYAKWSVPSTCGDSAANNCYTGTNAATLQAGGSVTTPTGKSLVYVDADGAGAGTFKVWKESGGNRVLAANGLDQWSKALNVSGIGQSATDFTDANLGTVNTLIEGRVCPGNVYIDATNKFTTTNCLYYSPSYPAQALDAAGTSQTNLGTIGLEGWNVAGAGNGTGASWYEGNIQTCSAKGMRLPTIYETTASSPASIYDPTADGTPSSRGGANGVPSSTWTWTASASTYNFRYYWVWSGTSNAYGMSVVSAVRCVLP